MRLANRTAIVTGAAQGLGRAIATRFVAEGANVVFADVNGAMAGAAARQADASGARARAVTVDTRNADQVAALVEAAERAFGNIDILINNAGGSGENRATEIEDVSESTWDEVIGINLKSTFLCCKSVVPLMKRQKYGRIVNVASGLAKGVGRPQGTGGAVLPYASAKAGILGLTYTLAKMLGPWNITVNVVVPGFMLTESGTRVRAWFDALGEPQRQALLQRNSMGRAGTPEEMASTVLFLASDEASYVSGATIDVHGAG
jgi:3-oxoacyl-[acyl-carrier protein] reductase